jgi:citrate synthase
MLIGKKGNATTAISTADASSITVRGRDLCTDLMGQASFTEYFALLMTGRRPTKEQVFFLDLLLVAIAEHGLVPTNQAARMTYAADPSSLQSAVAAGILGCGSVILGTSQYCGEFLLDVAKACDNAPGDDEAAVRSHVMRIRQEGGKVPGFGHPLHKPVDPRAQRILELAGNASQSRYAHLARVVERVVPEVWGKPLPMNVSMAIAAVLLDLGFPSGMLKSIPILARTASLLAHLAEEAENPIGFLMASEAEAAITYQPGIES